MVNIFIFSESSPVSRRKGGRQGKENEERRKDGEDKRKDGEEKRKDGEEKRKDGEERKKKEEKKVRDPSSSPLKASPYKVTHSFYILLI